MANIRTVKEKERKQIALLYNNAYRTKMKDAESWAKSVKLNQTRAIFEGNRLVSTLQILPYRIWIGGKLIPMGGICGVGTFADRQSMGYTGKLLTDAVKTMKNQKQPVSILYPFSHTFYGKYGWVIGHHNRSYTFNQRDILPYNEERKLVTPASEKDIPVIISIYERIASERYNLCAKRDAKVWKKYFKDMKDNNGIMYIIRDGKKPIGFFNCRNQHANWGFKSITDVIFLDNCLAVKDMMGFLTKLPSNVNEIIISAPYHYYLWPYLKNYYIDTKMNASFQFRVTDIKQAVKARGYKKDATGKVIVKVEDKYAPYNSGAWYMEFNEGKVIKAEKTDKRADICLSIQDFSQIYCGYRKATELCTACTENDDISTDNNEKLLLLDKIFFDNPTYLIDNF